MHTTVPPYRILVPKAVYARDNLPYSDTPTTLLTSIERCRIPFPADIQHHILQHAQDPSLTDDPDLSAALAAYPKEVLHAIIEGNQPVQDHFLNHCPSINRLSPGFSYINLCNFLLPTKIYHEIKKRFGKEAQIPKKRALYAGLITSAPATAYQITIRLTPEGKLPAPALLESLIAAEVRASAVLNFNGDYFEKNYPNIHEDLHVFLDVFPTPATFADIHDASAEYLQAIALVTAKESLKCMTVDNRLKEIDNIFTYFQMRNHQHLTRDRKNIN